MKYTIGHRIRQFRELKSISQKDFAVAIGVSPNRVSNWEHGVNRPDVDMLIPICQALKISADDLLDIKLNEEQLTEQEKQIIRAYRVKENMQQAVRVLLGLE